MWSLLAAALLMGVNSLITKRRRIGGRTGAEANRNATGVPCPDPGGVKMKGLRYGLAILSLVVFLLMIGNTASRYLTTPGLSVRSNPFIKRHFAQRKITLADHIYNDLTDGGIQAKITLSNNLFQVTLLVSAALAGLLIAREKEARLVLGGKGRLPEVAMFVFAAIFLLLAFVSHGLYLTEVSYLYFLAGSIAGAQSIADISDDNVNFLLNYQLMYLLVGILIAFFTFFSAHVLRERS